MLHEDTQKEVFRLQDQNARIVSDNQVLRREGDKQMSETHEVRKEYEYQASRNLDLANQVRDLDLKIKDREDQLYAIRKDLEH